MSVCVYVLSRLSGEDGNFYANFHASKQCALNPDRSKVCACVRVYVRVCFTSVMSAAVFSYSPIKPNASRSLNCQDVLLMLECSGWLPM